MQSSPAVRESKEQKGIAGAELIPYIPPKIDLSDLDNGFLLPPDQITAARSVLIEEAPTVFTKISLQELGLNLKYRVLIVKDEKDEPHLLAIYSGKRKDKHLGEGAFGKVILAQDLESGKYFAIKVISKKMLYAGVKEHKINSQLGKSLGAILFKDGIKKTSSSTATPAASVKSTPKAYMIMELAQGHNLQHYIREKGKEERRVPAYRLLDIAQQMLIAVIDLHTEHKLVHCDIKLENFVYDPEGNKTSLIDFGLTMEKGLDLPRRGTPFYAAPELIAGGNHLVEYGEKTDVYALGVALKELFGIPVEDREEDENKEGDDLRFYPLQELTEYGKNTDMIALLQEMIAKNPVDRPSLRVIRERFERIDREVRPTINPIVGIIDLKDFAACSESQRDEIIEALKNVDEVLLINSDPSKKIVEYQTLIRELQNNDLLIRNRVLPCPGGLKSPQLQAYIKGYEAEQRINIRKVIYVGKDVPSVKADKVFLLKVSGKKKSTDYYQKKIDKEIRIYESDISRIKKEMNDAVDKFKDHPTYQQLIKQTRETLSALEGSVVDKLKDRKVTVFEYHKILSDYYKKWRKITGSPYPPLAEKEKVISKLGEKKPDSPERAQVKKAAEEKAEARNDFDKNSEGADDKDDKIITIIDDEEEPLDGEAAVAQEHKRTPAATTIETKEIKETSPPINQSTEQPKPIDEAQISRTPAATFASTAATRVSALKVDPGEEVELDEADMPDLPPLVNPGIASTQLVAGDAALAQEHKRTPAATVVETKEIKKTSSPINPSTEQPKPIDEVQISRRTPAPNFFSTAATRIPPLYLYDRLQEARVKANANPERNIDSSALKRIEKLEVALGRIRGNEPFTREMEEKFIVSLDKIFALLKNEVPRERALNLMDRLQEARDNAITNFKKETQQEIIQRIDKLQRMLRKAYINGTLTNILEQKLIRYFEKNILAILNDPHLAGSEQKTSIRDRRNEESTLAHSTIPVSSVVIPTPTVEMSHPVGDSKKITSRPPASTFVSIASTEVAPPPTSSSSTASSPLARKERYAKFAARVDSALIAISRFSAPPTVERELIILQKKLNDLYKNGKLTEEKLTEIISSSNEILRLLSAPTAQSDVTAEQGLTALHYSPVRR